MKPLLFTRADMDKFSAVQNDITGTIVANLDKLFKISISVSIEQIDGGKVRLIFMYPFEDTQLLSQCVYIPADLATGILTKE